MKELSFSRFRGGGGRTVIFAGLWLAASVSLPSVRLGELRVSELAAQTVPPQFKPPVNLGPKINSPFFESDPFLTADGKKLFFVAARPSGFGQEDIWFSEWTDTGWTSARVLGPQINSGRREQSPSVSPDGQKLYYVDAERGGFNWDIWMSTWDSSANDWRAPIRLPYPVNTSGVEFSAHIGPDGQRLFFKSSAPPDSLFPGGREGFYVSVWDGVNWSVPQYLGSNVGWGEDEYPSITADGRWLYFMRWISVPTIYASEKVGGFWNPAVNVGSQLAGITEGPYITPSGDSLFFCTPSLNGFGGCDLWLSERKIPQKVPTAGENVRSMLVFLLTFIGFFLLKNRRPLTG